MGTLDNRIAVVTGASRGLGLEITHQLRNAGATVLRVARDGSNDPGIFPCDVRDPAMVENLFEHVLKWFGTIDILVCNAGVIGPIGRTEELSWSEWTDTVSTNLFGTVLCCRAVVPIMRSQQYGKIITLSGGGGANAFPFYSAYASSKVAIVRFTETLAEELVGTGIDINAVSPGALNTRILDESLAAGPVHNGLARWKKISDQYESGGDSIVNAAQLVVHLASPDTDGISGNLFSAVWDNWRVLNSRTWQNGSRYKLRRLAE